jgi:hypothetical protein
VRIECTKCGQYFITAQFPQVDMPETLQPALSAATRQSSQARTPLHLTVEHWQSYAVVHAQSGVSNKVDLSALRQNL